MTIDEKLGILPELMLSEIKIGEKIKAPSHVCYLEKILPGTRPGWNCNRIHGASKCLSGLTGFF